MTAPRPQDRIYFDPLPVSLRAAIRFSPLLWDVGSIFHLWKRENIDAAAIIENMREQEIQARPVAVT